jgi:preprotein translocase subunit SecD
MKRIALALVVLTLLGCKEVELLNEPDVVYRIQSLSKNTNIERSAKVLVSRLNEYRESFVSEIILSQSNEGVFITFRHGAPDESLISKLSSIKGYFEGGILDGSPPLLTNKDIMNAQAVLQNEKALINIALTQEAGHRFKRITAANLGETIGFYLDSQEILLAKIDSPLAQFFQISSENLEEAIFNSILLRNGDLDSELQVHKIN